MLTFEEKIIVRLDKKIVGHIVEVTGLLQGYTYVPKGSKFNPKTEDVYPTVDAVKKSLI